MPGYDDDPAFGLHRGGKIEIRPTVRVRDRTGLALAYTPGVGRVSSAIAADPSVADDYTWRSNVVAVITDGSAVLGLGDLGPLAALPVMEGKSLLFKEFGGVDAVPLCLDCRDVDQLVETVVRLAPSFGGINLEDIAAPRCFEVERRLDAALDIPVFHDDQHGTAVVVLAGLRNAATVTGRNLADLRAVVMGAGAAGVAVTRILVGAGIGDVAVVDSRGVIHPGRTDLTEEKQAIAEITNRAGLTGGLDDVMAGADVFIGVSAGSVPAETVALMSPKAIIFALANPEPEIRPEVASRYAAVVATGRSDFPNQVNNVLAFPGIFRGALAVRATTITESMKLAAADAIAASVGDSLAPDLVIPSVFDPWVGVAVGQAVAGAAIEAGVARRPLPLP
jgi:malate dehydrogenase (oxaloacetate-decarboxylating)